MKITIRKTLELIEGYALYRAEDNDMGKIYTWAHTALKPKCRKNHPEWTRELVKILKTPDMQWSCHKCGSTEVEAVIGGSTKYRCKKCLEPIST